MSKTSQLTLTDEYIPGLKTAFGSLRTADSSFQTKFWTADSSFQIKSGPPTAVFRSNMDRRQQFSDQVLDRRQQFSDAWVLFGVQIVTLRPIFSKTRDVAHRVTYTTEKSLFRTIIWASMSIKVYFPFKNRLEAVFQALDTGFNLYFSLIECDRETNVKKIQWMRSKLLPHPIVRDP